MLGTHVKSHVRDDPATWRVGAPTLPSRVDTPEDDRWPVTIDRVRRRWVCSRNRERCGARVFGRRL
jgi:hypothetical protein